MRVRSGRLGWNLERDFFFRPSATSCLVREPFALGTFDRVVGSCEIVDSEADAVRIAEIELGEVAVKVTLGAMLIDAYHAALEDREEALDGVHVGLGAIGKLAHPFLVNVLHGVVAVEATAGVR